MMHREKRIAGRTAQAALLAAVAFSSSRALATNVDWNGATDANWDTTTNWSNNTKPTSNDVVSFPFAVPGTGSSISLGSGESAGSLIFDTGYALEGGSLTLSSGAVTVTNSSLVTISGTLGGTSGLTKSGIGDLLLTGSNTYSGGTTINAGTVRIFNDA